MFALALARWRDASLVAAIGQSPLMLAQAATRSPQGRVRYIAGDAAALRPRAVAAETSPIEVCERYDTPTFTA